MTNDAPGSFSIDFLSKLIRKSVQYPSESALVPFLLISLLNYSGNLYNIPPSLPGSFSIDFLNKLLGNQNNIPLSLPGSFSIDFPIQLLRISIQYPSESPLAHFLLISLLNYQRNRYNIPLSLLGSFSIDFLITLITKSIQNVSEAAWLLFYRCPYCINKESATKCL